MVKRITKPTKIKDFRGTKNPKDFLVNKKTYYLCEECNFAYANKKFAAKCENWCKKYHSCNIEITKHSVSL